jgi:hypothetical protein
MKLHAGTNVIEKSGNFEESKFSIEASSKAFFILSDGLYSNKILAVVRELSTNAYDSHIDANKADVPFDVHLPTILDPVFFIRDYGTSMSHTSCMQLYTTYFHSTRNNNNEAVGCLGLGSKAPFAYSDSFTVEAYLDGKNRVYTAYKNEDGSPVFSLMDEFDTTEPDGIKVSIQVNSNDISRFASEAKKIYQFFKVKPNFVGEKIYFDEVNKILSGDNWFFDDNADENLVIMGQIAYPLDHYQLMGDGDNRESKFVQHSDGLRIYVNIGDVDITPSRESLSYSKDTKVNIKSIINSIANDISTKIEHQIQSQTSLFKARKAYVQISDQCSSIKNAIGSLQKSIEWNGQKLFDNIVNESINVKNKLSLTLISKSSYRKKINSSTDVEFVNFSGDMKVFVDDLTRGGLSRIKQFMREKQQAYGYEQKCYVYKLKDGETVDNNTLYDILGGATKEDVVLTSLLPKVVYYRESSGGGSPPVNIQFFNEETGTFEDCPMSVKYENAYYFEESKGSVKLSASKSVDTYHITQALVFAHENYSNEIDGMTFYVVKPSVIKNRNLNGRDNWSDAIPVVKSILENAVQEHKEDIIESFRRVDLSKVSGRSRWKDIFELTKTDNEVKRVVLEYNEYMSKKNARTNSLQTIHSLSKMFGIESVDLSSKDADNDMFSKRFDRGIKKYPMLEVCGFPWSEDHRKIIADYIDSLENKVEVYA